MAAGAIEDQDEPTTLPPTVLLHIRIPRLWNDALREAAEMQGLKTAQLVRLILGGFLRNRLSGAPS